MPISCIICVYNEAERIENILKAVRNHPALGEVIVVNDGSTDSTETVLKRHSEIRLISYTENRGKTYAMGRGIAAAKYPTLMFLDADLAGLTAENISALAEPVLSGRADASLSLRKNSLRTYRLIGIDFVTGERVVPASLFPDTENIFSSLPRWGAEVFINERMIRANLRIAVVDWPTVYNIRKYHKVGFIKGISAEIGMVRDALSVLPLPSVIRQHIQLLRRKVGRTERIAAPVRMHANIR